jgi:hypothetical protein
MWRWFHKRCNGVLHFHKRELGKPALRAKLCWRSSVAYHFGSEPWPYLLGGSLSFLSLFRLFPLLLWLVCVCLGPLLLCFWCGWLPRRQAGLLFFRPFFVSVVCLVVCLCVWSWCLSGWFLGCLVLSRGCPPLWPPLGVWRC